MTTPSLFAQPPLAQAPATAAPAQPAPAAPAPVVAPQVLITELEVKQALPSHLRASVNQSLVDSINNISNDPIVAQNIRDNFIGFTTVLKEGKYKTQDYVHAVAYVSFKLMGYSNKDAYARTFPQRWAALVARGVSDKDISAYVAAYHRGKLVNLIMDQSLVPVWVLNQDIQQKAINRLADLMLNANSEKVQAEAAIGLLAALKKPEPKGGDFQVNINTAETSGMKEMKDTLAQLAQQQRDMIAGGAMKTIDVAASRLVREEAEDQTGE